MASHLKACIGPLFEKCRLPPLEVFGVLVLYGNWAEMSDWVTLKGSNRHMYPLVVDRAKMSSTRGWGVNDKAWFLMQNVSV